MVRKNKLILNFEFRNTGVNLALVLYTLFVNQIFIPKHEFKYESILPS
jgi:hypothetical protein